MYCKTSGADHVQDVTTAVSGEVYIVKLKHWSNSINSVADLQPVSSINPPGGERKVRWHIAGSENQ